MQQSLHSHLIIIFLLILVSINLFILDLQIFSPQSVIRLSDISTAVKPNPTSMPLPQNNIPGTENLACPQSCLSVIKDATQSTDRIGATDQELSALSQSQATISKPSEYYIPLGSGNTTKSDWEDLTATETMIDPGNYRNIKEAYFIASLRNPTQNGQIEARLYDVTDGHMVWGSHVIMNGRESQTITSDKITLETGSKLYRVQLKSGMQYQAFLDNAKIRIISE